MLLHRFGRYMIRRMARAHGFLDPVNLLAKLGRFSQPSEVAAPTELLRAGALFHARGLINSQVIQNNLDWVWPFWVEKQFNPKDVSFVPRAFSATHINLTHRNWTAAGLPDLEETPLVDPRGLVTPFWDGWSLDAWIVGAGEGDLIPSRSEQAEQCLHIDGQHVIETKVSSGHMMLNSSVEVIKENGQAVCLIRLSARADAQSRLVVSLRPYNSEGVSSISEISQLAGHTGWCVNKKWEVLLGEEPARYVYSDYKKGDVYHHLEKEEDRTKVTCAVDMATAAAVFPLADGKKELVVRVPLIKEEAKQGAPKTNAVYRNWADVKKGACQLTIPDEHFQHLFDAAVHTLLIHTSKNVYAGPYTYKRFWFRDAVYITYTLICCGFTQRAEKIIDAFPKHQTMTGYFESQEGEWDSNGQVLWLIGQFCRMTGTNPKPAWKEMILKGARWIMKKRLPDKTDTPHSGLMPAGFSAEHFGPNDYYYWDDFWSAAGLKSAATLADQYGHQDLSMIFKDEAQALESCVEKSLQTAARRLGRPAMPASPYRRLDSASVGCLVEGYPLQLNMQKENRLLDTAKFLTDNCLVHGGLFHDMSHSGINPYLTLHVAQVLLQAGDPKYFDLMRAIADLASPTGQWPEAIHPATKGGCMGDGQHVWAASEWILMMRNCFVREEKESNKLILLSGLPRSWYESGRSMMFGPASTDYGTIRITLKPENGNYVLDWQADWQGKAPAIEVKTPEDVIVRWAYNKSD